MTCVVSQSYKEFIFVVKNETRYKKCACPHPLLGTCAHIHAYKHLMAGDHGARY